MTGRERRKSKRDVRQRVRYAERARCTAGWRWVPRTTSPGRRRPLLTGDGLSIREHFAEPPGLDVIHEPPDRDLLRDPRMRPGLLHLLLGVFHGVGEAVEPG